MGSMPMQPNVPVVSVSDLPDDAVMVDVRERNEWRAGHAPDAVLIPMGDLPSQIEELPLGDGPLAVVCRSGNRSAPRTGAPRLPSVSCSPRRPVYPRSATAAAAIPTSPLAARWLGLVDAR